MTAASRKHQEDVTRFFDCYASDFHSIYGRQNASTFGTVVDRLTRQGMFARFEETVRQCQAVRATSLLDVGCGPGVHDVILAEKLKMLIRGVDIAPRMIEIAKANAAARGVSDLCNYSVMDFMEFEGGLDYDASLSLGVIEYIEDPVPFIRKMISHTRKRVMFSLPVKWHILTPQRIVRYRLRKCPLKFYSVAGIERLMRRCGVANYEIKQMNRDYLIVIATD
jgi:cyclopropane fatty-acyl-phospholipid synthase-like methyltransferase